MIPKFFFCRGCRFPTNSILCGACRNALTRNDRILPPPVEGILGVAPVLFSFDSTQKIIRSWKEEGGSVLERTLFQMAPGLRRELLNIGFSAIVPIPQSARRSYRRGHDSALSVARYFSRQLHVPVVSLLELKNRDPARQTGQSRFERDFSPNPFRVGDRHLDALESETTSKFLIVDDLMTSGSTLAKAAARIHEREPEARCWGGALGFRPRTAAKVPVPPALPCRNPTRNPIRTPSPEPQNDGRSAPAPGTLQTSP